ncbi:N(6)-adenine-specific methyltransferase METTL4 [Tiliqua scincoides]|uniref:N(6)-adenine-specific methyltransferase METTL4 n=1 Tax=Tiliqua scincoides TaxID=71010 RepID=UPI00346289A2
MSIVVCLPAGWLLDHLSFINKSGYQLCHPHDDSVGVFCDDTATASSDMEPAVSATPGTASSYRSSTVSDFKDAGKKTGETIKETYIFWEEFFNVLKPHITAYSQVESQQRNSGLGREDAGSEQHEGAQNGNSYSAANAKKKRKRRSELNHGERAALEYHLKISGVISEGTRILVQEGLRSGFLKLRSTEQIGTKTHIFALSDCGLAELCEMAKQFSSVNEAVSVTKEDISAPEHVPVSCITENNTAHAKIVTVIGQKYLFPPKSSFLLSDISCMQPLLDYNKKFGVIVIDPPWENKSVKRSNRYGYLSPWQIKQIPVPALAAPDCLVVTWVTNRQKHLRFVKNVLYPHWSVRGVVEWYWVKVTKSGEFVFPLDSLHKKPYEVLILGRVQRNPNVPLSISEDETLHIPDHKLIVSVPCTLHSHKPPLTEILKEYTKPDVECLELFARNLQPGWTSWGNEVLKFQHLDYFTTLQKDNSFAQ